MPAPLIGIAASFEEAVFGDRREVAQLIPRAYVNAVQRAGGVALVLPVSAPERVETTLGLVDGVVIAGGADIDPSSYGADPDPATVGTVPARDRFELALTSATIAADVPLLGVCRGMQLINVARGGTLIQDLPLTHGQTEHRRVMGTFAGSDHAVAIEPGTLAERVVGATRHRVMSHHHQAVDGLGRGLRVSAISERDRVVEAIELPEARFALGVQWHPEADPHSPVIAALVAAAS